MIPIKMQKTETENELLIERILYTKRFSLTLDKDRCVGCGICREICPKETIELQVVPKEKGGKATLPLVDIDEQKCHYCGMCIVLCPFGALKIRVNGEESIPVIEAGSFPQLIRDITIIAEKCEESCVDCEEYCPLNLIKIRFKQRNVDLNIDKEHCVCCRLCDLKCPHDAMRVRKIFQGKLTIHPEKCPEGCQDCLDVCPITGTLYLTEGGRVAVNEMTCIYCGTCQQICPEKSALELKRTYIRHTPVQSGAWNIALEKLTSSNDLTKELRAKGSRKTREVIKKRLS